MRADHPQQPQPIRQNTKRRGFVIINMDGMSNRYIMQNSYAMNYLFYQTQWSMAVYNQNRVQQTRQNTKALQCIKQKVVSTEIRQFNIFQGHTPNVVSYIQNVKFTQLQRLYLGANGINNIEALSNLDCQVLQILNLQRNRITRISGLNKCTKPGLKWIVLDQNQINQFKSLARLNSKDAIYQYLILEQFPQQNLKFYNLSLVLKLNIRTLKNVLIHSNSDINQEKTKQQIVKKYNPVTIQQRFPQ